MLSNYGNFSRLLKIKNKLKIGCFFTNKYGENFRYFVGVFNKKFILIALVRCEMIIANSYPTCTRGIIAKYLASVD